MGNGIAPTAVRDPKNSMAELQTPPSQTHFLHSLGGKSLISSPQSMIHKVYLTSHEDS